MLVRVAGLEEPAGIYHVRPRVPQFPFRVDVFLHQLPVVQELPGIYPKRGEEDQRDDYHGINMNSQLLHLLSSSIQIQNLVQPALDRNGVMRKTIVTVTVAETQAWVVARRILCGVVITASATKSRYVRTLL